jgi:hypothetical protein
MLIGAICLGFYEVIYKMSLPEGHGGVASSAEVEVQDLAGSGYEAVQTEDDDPTVYPSRPALPLEATRRSSSLLLVRQESSHPRSSSLPLALHANYLTSLIGAATLLLFWIPIPLLHWTGLEEFELPYGHFMLLAVICIMGATYVSCGIDLRLQCSDIALSQNAGFMASLLNSPTCGVLTSLSLTVPDRPARTRDSQCRQPPCHRAGRAHRCRLPRSSHSILDPMWCLSRCRGICCPTISRGGRAR